MVSLRPRHVLPAKMWPRRPSNASMVPTLPGHRNTNRDKSKKKIMFCPFHRNQYLGITQHALNVFLKDCKAEKFICLVNSVELDYSYLHLFQVCPAVYIWRKSIGKRRADVCGVFPMWGKRKPLYVSICHHSYSEIHKLPYMRQRDVYFYSSLISHNIL